MTTYLSNEAGVVVLTQMFYMGMSPNTKPLPAGRRKRLFGIISELGLPGRPQEGGGHKEGYRAWNAVGPFFFPPRAPSVPSEGEGYGLADLIISCIVIKCNRR